MTKQLLEDIILLDISSSAAASQATWLLAECGATVIKVEVVGGDPARVDPYFSVFNRSKFCVELDIYVDSAALFKWLGRADVLVHDLSPGNARQLSLDADSLKQVYPNLVVSAVTAMPAGHSLEDMPADDSLVMAYAGLNQYHDAQRRTGPAFQQFPLGSQGSAYLAAVGIVTRLYLCAKGKPGGAVNTSLLQGTMTVLLMLNSRPEFRTPGFDLAPSSFNPLVQCADGVWLHLMSQPDEAPLVKAELALINGADKAAARAANPIFNAHLPLFPLYKAIFIKRPSKAWLSDLWANDVAVDAAAEFGQLYFDKQARLNHYVEHINDEQWGEVLQPGSPIGITPAAQIKWPCQTLDNDNLAVLEAFLAQAYKPTKSTVGAIPSPVPPTPLAGVKVLDLGNFLAGPLAAMMMADLGAEVIKLESISGDMMRWAEWAFCGCSRGKRCISVDLKSPDTKVILERLVQWADIVHHNIRMPAAKKLGVDYASLKVIKPSIIYCHVGAYGPEGERSDWPGYDQMMQASSGWEQASAGEGNTPVWLRFGMMDHLCATASLLATLMALYHRELTGEGQFVRASLLGAATVSLSATMGLPNGELLPYAKVDSLQLGTSSWRRLYCCNDGWISVLFNTEAGFIQWQKNVGVSTLAELETLVGSMTRNAALASVFAAKGYAVIVRMAVDENILDNSEFKHLGLLANYSHPHYGNFEQVGALWHFDDMALKLDTAAPTLGQHSSEVLTDLQFTPSEIKAFFTRQLVAEKH